MWIEAFSREFVEKISMVPKWFLRRDDYQKNDELLRWLIFNNVFTLGIGESKISIINVYQSDLHN